MKVSGVCPTKPPGPNSPRDRPHKRQTMALFTGAAAPSCCGGTTPNRNRRSYEAADVANGLPGAIEQLADRCYAPIVEGGLPEGHRGATIDAQTLHAAWDDSEVVIRSSDVTVELLPTSSNPALIDRPRVAATHLPTGIRVTMDQGSTYRECAALALRLLNARVKLATR